MTSPGCFGALCFWQPKPMTLAQLERNYKNWFNRNAYAFRKYATPSLRATKSQLEYRIEKLSKHKNSVNVPNNNTNKNSVNVPTNVVKNWENLKRNAARARNAWLKTPNGQKWRMNQEFYAAGAAGLRV